MRSGQILVIGIVAATAMFGAGVWYTQTRAWYVQLEDAPIVMTRHDGEEEALLVDSFDGIDAETSPLRYRACFEPTMSLPTLTETFQPYGPATPLNAPGWFSCFDADAIGEALESGSALAFLGQQNQPYGFDIVVTVFDTGQGYAWRQINHCGTAAFGGDPLPPGCPEPP
ncbi:MAG: DUF6446 family protein [Pseudomonadota bacterium]